MAERILGKALTPGRDKDGQPYARTLNFQRGYGELCRIVADLQKDVKRVNQCLTLRGARQYAAKRKNWEAREEDITGPEGRPDGIKEVYVTDAKGNLKIINGMTLKKSDYPKRKLYRTMFPTKDQRKKYPYTGFIHEFTRINDNADQDGLPFYALNPVAETKDKQFTDIQPYLSAKALYKQFVFKPMYEEMKEAMDAIKLPPMKRAQVYNIALAQAFRQHIQRVALARILEKDPENATEKEIKKALRNKDFRPECEIRTAELLNDDEEFPNAQWEIKEIIGHTMQNIPVNVMQHEDENEEPIEDGADGIPLPDDDNDFLA